MLIGKQYADNKMYRGIKHYDNMPLTSEDIHEYSDTVHMKNAYIMNNLVGYGTLNKPVIDFSLNGGSIKLEEPLVVIIDGDIALVQSSGSNPLLDSSKISNLGIEKGTVCALGWYQHVLSSTTMREYGGVDNSVLPNDLLNEKFKVQLSTRYQFRWSVVVLNSEDLKGDTIHIECSPRDKNGDIPNGDNWSLDSKGKINDVFIFSSDNTNLFDEDDVTSDLYLIPLLDYTYNGKTVIEAECRRPIEVGGSPFLISEVEPEGEYPNGTTWYNPITREFKTYIEGTGFVSSASKMAFLQYQSIYEVTETINTLQDITVPINISEMDKDSILQVVYEGIILTKEENYTVNYDAHTITLKGFTTTEGDHIYFTVTKLVEANDITSITATFIQHMNTTSSNSVEGHVKLSDTLSDSDASEGVAATPKMVKDSKLLIDDATKVSYKLGIDNGLLYIEEV